VRKLPALFVAVGLVASLAACSSGPTSASCTPKPDAGSASTLITATGDFGKKTAADFPTPLIAPKTQASVLTEGTGRTLTAGDYADFEATIWVASTGAYITGTSFSSASPALTHVGSDDDVLGTMAVCSNVGSRVAGITAFGKVFGDADPAGYGLASAKDSVVVILDLVGGFASKATGADQVSQPGMPSVVTAPDGTPGVTLTSGTPLETLRSSVLKQGDGATVNKGDGVIFQYEEISWATPATVVGSSWEDGSPKLSIAKAFDPTDESGLFPGTSDAVIGQKVGSQVLVVVPPKDSYPASATGDGAGADATRIYVIDILSTQKQ